VARPTLLSTDSIVDHLLDRDGAEVEPARGMLTRVCELTAFQNAIPFDPCFMATVLRTAPRLRTFITSQQKGGESSWLTAPTAPVHPAFVGLVHGQLRDFRILDTLQHPYATTAVFPGCGALASRSYASWKSAARHFSRRLLCLDYCMWHPVRGEKKNRESGVASPFLILEFIVHFRDAVSRISLRNVPTNALSICTTFDSKAKRKKKRKRHVGSATYGTKWEKGGL
jgi:hypothetical protein